MEGIHGFKEIEINTTITDLLEMIEGRISEFSSSTTFRKMTKKKKNETNYTTTFNQFMMKKQDRFRFHAEVSQKGSFRCDIMVLDDKDDETIMVIEAKILPTPIDKKRKEHEYVNGEKGAGIQRFKDGNHGVDLEDNPIAINGMIAYIKEQDFAHWHTKVNQWIKEANWEDSELLTQKYPPQQDKYISKHPRKDGNVTLHHFWVMVNQ